jgi:transmembrane sensor
MNKDMWNSMMKRFADEPIANDENQQLDQWLKEDENRLLYLESYDAIKKAELHFGLKRYNTDKAWQDLNRKQGLLKKRTISRALWAVSAAAVVLILLVTQLIPSNVQTEKMNLLEFSTSITDNTRPERVLPDGTRVTLNRESKLLYPEEFNDSIRQVTLVGEAFFEVAPNPNMPFVIKTEGASVKVLGTSFNVAANKGAETTEVLVRTGSVVLEGSETLARIGLKTVVLFPGEKGVLHYQTGNIKKENNYNPNQLAWYTQSLKFDSETLAEVLNTLNRTYNIEFVLTREVEPTLTISATFEHQEIDYILEVIGLTLGLSIEKQAPMVYAIQTK